MADKFLQQLRSIFETRQDDYKQQLKTRVEAAKNHFVPLLKQFSAQVQKQQELVAKEKKVKAYLQELAELDALFYKQLQLVHKADAMVRSALENTEFSKAAINTEAGNRERLETLKAASAEAKETAQKEKGKKKKKQKARKLKSGGSARTPNLSAAS